MSSDAHCLSMLGVVYVVLCSFSFLCIIFENLLFGNISSNNEDIWLTEAIEKLEDRIEIKEGDSGLITINIWMEEPQLAVQVSEYVYNSIIKYNSITIV